MDQFVALFSEFEPWHWWATAAVLIAVEIMMPTFYFLWPGVAAAVVGVLLYFIPSLEPDTQLLLFAVLAVVSTVAWKRLAPASWTTTDPHPTLNRRAAQYEGRRARVASDFAGGRGAVFIDDTRWSAVTNDGSDPRQGETVVVTGADGAVLTVSKAAA